MTHEYDGLSFEDRMALDDKLWYESEETDNVWYMDDNGDD